MQNTTFFKSDIVGGSGDLIESYLIDASAYSYVNLVLVRENTSAGNITVTFYDSTGTSILTSTTAISSTTSKEITLINIDITSLTEGVYSLLINSDVDITLYYTLIIQSNKEVS